MIAMVRYKLTIAYDGTHFSGFQRQPAKRTVQEELEKTLMRLNRHHALVVHGSGRTDAGVHAKGQVCHVDMPEARDPEKLRFALDTQSPDDIACLAVSEAPDSFHARYSPHTKTYEFLLDNNRARNPLTRHVASFFPYRLDIDRMQEAAGALLGRHDMTGFTAGGTSVQDKVRTIMRAAIVPESDNYIRFVFTGDGFLYKQIRNMVGTLLKIGNGQMPSNQINQILTAKDRRLAGPTASPEGLCLMAVTYCKDGKND